MLPLHPATHVWQGNRRCYDTPHGILPGVTTVLGATRPPEEQAKLDNWRRRVGEAEADRICQEAIYRGNGLHLMLEHHFAPEQVDLAELDKYMDSDALAYWDVALPFVRSIDKALLVEGAVSHPAGYAGLVDCLAMIDGALTLIDWKTSGKPKRREWIGDYLLQAAAYVTALNHTYDGLDVQQAKIAVATTERLQIFDMDADDLEVAWAQFQERLSRYSPPAAVPF